MENIGPAAAGPAGPVPTPMRPAAQTRDVGLHVAVAGSELSECILRSTVATRVHGIAKKDGRGV